MARIRKSKTNTTYFLDIPKMDDSTEKIKKWKKLKGSEEVFFSH